MGAAPMTFVAEIAPRKASGTALSIYRNSGDVGLLLGPILSGLAVDFFGSEVALAMNISVLVSAALAFREQKKSGEDEEEGNAGECKKKDDDDDDDDDDDVVWYSGVN